MKKVLYLGLDPSRYLSSAEVVHCPVIEIAPRPFAAEVEFAFRSLSTFSHVLFTSRSAVSIYVDYCKKAGYALPTQPTYLSIGQATAAFLEEVGLKPAHTAKEETAEGVIALLKTLPLEGSYLFFPRSAQGRTLIQSYLQEAAIRCWSIDLYDTRPRTVPLPELSSFDLFVFTSPSTVDAFFHLAGCLPPIEKCSALGPITRKKIELKTWQILQSGLS